MVHARTSSIFADSSSEHFLAGLAPHGTVNFHAWPAGRELGWHGHAFLQVILVLDGSLELDWGAGWRQMATAQAHVLPPGVRHRLRSRGHRQCGLNFASRPDARGLLAALLAAVPQPLLAAWPDGPALAAQVQGALDPRGPAGRLDLGLRLDRCALGLLAVLQAGPAADAADRLLAWLADRRERPVGVEAAARALGRSRSGLQALCRTRFGCGLGHLHERLRLERAAGILLAEPGLTVAEVAQRCGYAEVFGFSRAFARVMGRPPAAWRRQQAAGGG